MKLILILIGDEKSKLNVQKRRVIINLNMAIHYLVQIQKKLVPERKNYEANNKVLRA